MAVTILCPMALDGPGWTDEAEERRRRAAARVRAAIDALQAAGIQARGEVLDGDAAEAARIARDDYRADAVLLAITRGGPWDYDSAVEPVRAAAAPLELERVVVDAEAPAAPPGS
jgi:hypothetical protein